MPNTTLILNGFKLLENVKIKIIPHGGYQDEGQINIPGGNTAFEADDIIVVHIGNANSDLEVVPTSIVTGMTVYDSAADYFNGIPRYEYTTAPRGINIRADVSGLGDTFLRFNANALLPGGPGHPDLSQVLIAAGQDLSVVESGQAVIIYRFTDNDYDENSVIDPGTVEVANGAFATENNIFSMICFAHGTLIDVPCGPRYIDTLKPGDLVNTLGHGPQSVRWIGGNMVSGMGRHAPVHVKADALGNIRDLYVSPNHRMLVRGTLAELHYGHHEGLVAANHLVNGTTIRIEPRAQAENFHFLLDRHEIVFAKACPSESLYLGEQSPGSIPDEGRAKIIELFPEYRFMRSGPQLARYALDRHESDVWKMCA